MQPYFVCHRLTNGITITNKMNCELMLTYDIPTYMFNVHKNQLSRQTKSSNLTGPKIRFLSSIVAAKNGTNSILDGRMERRKDGKR